MKIQLGDLVVINKSKTVGFVSSVSHSRWDFSIEILKKGSDSKTAWYDQEEATLLVPMSETLKQGLEIINSPLFAALNELKEENV